MPIRSLPLKPSHLAAAIMLGLAVPGIGLAQDAAPDSGKNARTLDTVTVTGYRASVEKVLDIKRSDLAIEGDKLQLKQDIYTAYYSASGSFQTFVAREKAVATAQRSFDLASRRYELGVMQTIEWLNNQNNLTRAKVDRVVAQYEYVFRMKVLEFYKGQGLRL